MTTRRGTKDPSLLLQTKRPDQEAGMVLVTGKPLRVGEDLLPIGVVVPGAANWPRLDAWISCRQIKRVSADSEYTTYEDFVASLEAAKAEAAENIVELDPQEPAAPAEPAVTPETQDEVSEPKE